MTAALLALVLSAGPARAQEDSSRGHPGLIGVGGLVLFYNSEGPLSFVSATPGGLPPGAKPLGEVKGRSCQHGVSVPLTASIRSTNISAAAGNGGFRKALEGIRKARPEVAGIYDVKVDFQILSILGLYRRVCTEITARGFGQG